MRTLSKAKQKEFNKGVEKILTEYNFTKTKVERLPWDFEFHYNGLNNSYTCHIGTTGGYHFWVFGRFGYINKLTSQYNTKHNFVATEQDTEMALKEFDNFIFDVVELLKKE